MEVLATNELSSLEELHDFYNSSNHGRGLTAIKQGLDPLATILWRQEKNVVPEDDALAFFDEKSEISSQQEALDLARAIVAERIRDNKEARKELRNLTQTNGTLILEIIREDHPELARYKQCLPALALPLTEKIDHIFEILEAESKGIALLYINIPQEQSLKLLEKFFIKKETAAGQHVCMAMEDSYQRFLKNTTNKAA